MTTPATSDLWTPIGLLLRVTLLRSHIRATGIVKVLLRRTVARLMRVAVTLLLLCVVPSCQRRRRIHALCHLGIGGQYDVEIQRTVRQHSAGRLLVLRMNRGRVAVAWVGSLTTHRHCLARGRRW